jgi:hypothetical protein
MPSLSLTLCGSVRWQVMASLRYHRLEISGLLAYLALEPGAHSRDELTALLWGEYPEEKAKASLRQRLRTFARQFRGARVTERRSRSQPARSIATSTHSFDWRRVTRAAADFPVSRFSRASPSAVLGIRGLGRWAEASLVKRITEVLTAVTRDAPRRGNGTRPPGTRNDG